MRYRPPRNKWGADFAEDYEKNLEDIERDITGVEEIVEGSKVDAEQALTFATEAKGKAESVQAQFNQVVIEGDSSVEAAQARVDAKNVAHPTLKARADSDYNEVTAQLAQTGQEVLKKTLRQSIVDRYKFPKYFQRYALPSTFSFNSPLVIFSDGYKFYTNYKKERFKNQSTNTYFVSSKGNDTNNGLSENAPFKQLSKALSTATNNDTIVLLEGDYYRDSINGVVFNKNINIVTKGKVRVFIANNDHSYTKTAGYTNVYQAVRSNIFKVIDAEIDENGLELAKVNSITEVDALPGSYYVDVSNNFYVHTYSSDAPNHTNIVALLVANSWIVTNINQNIQFYMENLKIFGGQSGTFTINPESNNTALVCLDGVELYHGAGLGDNGNLLNGYTGTIILNKCIGMYGEKDGFNYKKTSLSANSSYPAPKFIEIDCISANNGLKNRIPNQDASHNGSTAHNNCLGIRMNGAYYNNMGGNVADVGTGCKTLNFDCLAYDSACEYNNEKNTDFTAQQAGAEVWLINCKAYNSTSKFNIYGVSGTTMHVWDTMYDVITGSGTKDIINPL